MRHLFVSLLIVILLISTTPVSSMIYADEGLADKRLDVTTVLSNHIEASGGAAAYTAIQNIRIQLVIEEPEFIVRGDYRATSLGYMRIDIYDGESRIFSEGIDELGGWQQFGEGTPIEKLSAEGFAALNRGIDENLQGLYKLAERGHQAEALEPLTHNGVAYHRIGLTTKDGFERHYFIHPETWMIDYTRESSALHPDMDPEQRPVESYNSKFMNLCGIRIGGETQTIDLETREQIQQSMITDSQCNLDLQQLAISRPES